MNVLSFDFRGSLEGFRSYYAPLQKLSKQVNCAKVGLSKLDKGKRKRKNLAVKQDNTCVIFKVWV